MLFEELYGEKLGTNMAITVKDLLQLQTLRNFKVVAGQQGMSRTVKTVEILDFEFAQGVGDIRTIAFTDKSLVLSSLLFAKDQPKLLTEAIDKLLKLGVSALAYKPVIYKELPREVIDFANQEEFAILSFGGDEFFEDIILEVMEAVKKERNVEFLESHLSLLFSDEINSEDVRSICEKMNPGLKQKVMTVNIKLLETNSEQEILHNIRRYSPSENLKSKTVVCKFKKSIMIILTQEEVDDHRFKAMLDDVLIACQLSREKIIAGYSNVHDTDTRLNEAVKEARFARIVAEMEGASERRYSQIGLYQFLLPEQTAKHREKYMRNYLGPLFDEGDPNAKELLKTAVQFVLAHGEMQETAHRLFCHKNTVRYRMSRLHEKLDPHSNEKVFYEHLSAAIKIFLIHRYKEE